MPPSKRGNGRVHKTKNGKRWEAHYKGKYVGTFDTEAQAEAAILALKEMYLKDPDGFVMPPLKRGNGRVYKSKNGKRWKAYYKGKYLGTFDTEAQAEAAILARKEKIRQKERSHLKNSEL